MVNADIERILPYEQELFGTEAWAPDSYRAELADRRYRHYLVAECPPDRTGLDGTGLDGTGLGDTGLDGTGPGDTGPVAGDLVGWAGLMVVAETAQILTIGVVPAAQRRGIGQILLDGLLAEARRRRAGEVMLEVRVDNDAARRLYERNLFRALRVRRGYYDLGRVDAVEMKREL